MSSCSSCMNNLREGSSSYICKQATLVQLQALVVHPSNVSQVHYFHPQLLASSLSPLDLEFGGCFQVFFSRLLAGNHHLMHISVGNLFKGASDVTRGHIYDYWIVGNETHLLVHVFLYFLTLTFSKGKNSVFWSGHLIDSNLYQLLGRDISTLCLSAQVLEHYSFHVKQRNWQNHIQ